jgi:hypothetical protein
MIGSEEWFAVNTQAIEPFILFFRKIVLHRPMDL